MFTNKVESSVVTYCVNTLHLCAHLMLCFDEIFYVWHQACHCIQSSWLCKLQNCLAASCTRNWSKWPCVIVALEGSTKKTALLPLIYSCIFRAWKVQCSICWSHWQ